MKSARIESVRAEDTGGFLTGQAAALSDPAARGARP